MYEKRDAAFKKWFFEENKDISKEAVDCCHLAFNAGWAAHKKEVYKGLIEPKDSEDIS